MALGDSIESIILPEKRTEWDNNIRDKWFVQNPNDVHQAREPGKYNIFCHVLAIYYYYGNQCCWFMLIDIYIYIYIYTLQKLIR